MDSRGSSNGKYSNVLTDQTKNHQMFTYCPNLSQRTCGISNDALNRDTTLIAKTSTQSLSPGLRHRAGDQNTREHDGCYYILKSDGGISEGSVSFKIKKMKEMNVYIYKGLNRDDATIGLVPGNQMPSIG
jgi:hypothetical protein